MDDFGSGGGSGGGRSFMEGIVLSIVGFMIFGVIAIMAVVAFKAWQHFSVDESEGYE
jgi:hypothetical protein